MAKVKICETILRDAHQSLIATRMTTDQMIPILNKLDDIGYNSLEAWGGATFDSCIRFLNEDPWQRLRKIKDNVKKTPLQMLFRGQNILGYRHYADDVVEYFVQKSVANGIDIVRIFDALNDIRNLKTAVKATKKEGAHCQIALSYTLSPIHNIESFVNFAKQVKEEGADSICIKDMAGLLTPYDAYNLVKAIKSETKLPVDVHTHYTSGLASMTYLKAVEAGADVIDCAISSFALGTSQPATESMVAAFKGTEYDTGLSLEKLTEIKDYFAPIRNKAIDSGLLNTKVLGVDADTLLYQVPGGMLSNLVSQLKDAGKEEKFNEVLKEIPKVREESGYPPLVTPTSQIVGTQAVLNVLFGRYKMVSKEFKAMIKGEYGKTPGKISDEFRKQIIGDEMPITKRPADDIAPEMESIKQKAKNYMIQDEDALTYALFDKVAIKFFENRQDKIYGVDTINADSEKKIHPIV